MTRRDPRILIIGGGPTGLGAAWRLQEIGYTNWALFDAARGPGGLASSVVDSNGFVWDLGGHVLFSHYEYFDALMEELLGDSWLVHERESWVWMRNRFIPYPLQQNVWRLPEEDLIMCLNGFLTVHAGERSRSEIETFHDWILRNFGQGMADVFLVPYNEKVWAYHPSALGTGWMGERVANVNLKRTLENLVRRKDDCTWGPNATFRFPRQGGTGAIWKELCSRLPDNNLSFGMAVTDVSVDERRVWFANGASESFDFLISTLPLDCLLKSLTDAPSLSSLSTRFIHSSTHVVGVGIEGETSPSLSTKSWIYFPEPDLPFYRVTVFSNYSPFNVPEPGRYWSLMAEVSESSLRPVNPDTVTDQVIEGLTRSGLLPAESRVASRWHRKLEYGYPTPFLGRDALLEEIDPKLCSLGIWSRGRFGAWKYEVSNQDHSLMQGVESVDRIVFGAEEITYRYPDLVNSRKGVGRRPLLQPVINPTISIPQDRAHRPQPV